MDVLGLLPIDADARLTFRCAPCEQFAAVRHHSSARAIILPPARRAARPPGRPLPAPVCGLPRGRLGAGSFSGVS